jgi:hypothetical protein
MAAPDPAGGVPARPRHPRDNAKVETGVTMAERAVWGPRETPAGGPLIGGTAAPQSVARPRDRLNPMPFQTHPGSRWRGIAPDERPRRQPCPAHSCEDGDGRDPTGYPGYPMVVDQCYDSVPVQLVGQVRVTASTVESLADHQ